MLILKSNYSHWILNLIYISQIFESSFSFDNGHSNMKLQIFKAIIDSLILLLGRFSLN